MIGILLFKCGHDNLFLESNSYRRFSLVFRATFLLLVMLIADSGVAAQKDPVITLRRTACFGTCPVYSLEIFEDGLVRYLGTEFVEVKGEHKSVIPQDAVESLVGSFLRADYFSLQDKYETYKDPKGQVWKLSDLPTAYTTLRVGNRKKSVEDYAFAPEILRELELEVDRVANSHRWTHGARDDLKQWEVVRSDVYTRIKPGMSRFMQAAGSGDLRELARGRDSGIDINAADETGWTALMLASAMCQEEAVRQLLDWGAEADLKDKNGDTALIGASAAFCTTKQSREGQAHIVRLLLRRGANPEWHDNRGETALMAVTTYGNVSALRALLDAGARPEAKDNAGKSAVDYAHTALKKYYDHFWTAELRKLTKLLEARQ